jgi:hypothetical protein
MKSKQSSIPQNNNNNEPEKTSGSAVSDKKIRGNKKIEDDDDLFGIEERKREIEERKQRDLNQRIESLLRSDVPVEVQPLEPAAGIVWDHPQLDKPYKLGTGATFTYFEEVESMEGIDLKNRELVTVKKRRFALVMGGVLNQPPFVIDLDRNSIDYAHVGGMTIPQRWGHTATLDPKGENILVIGGMNESKRFNDIHVLMEVNQGPKKMHFGELHQKNARFIGTEEFMRIYLHRWNQPMFDPCSGEFHVNPKDQNDCAADYWCGCNPRKFASEKHKEIMKYWENHWTEKRVEGTLPALSYHTTNTAGSRMIVFGGKLTKHTSSNALYEIIWKRKTITHPSFTRRRHISNYLSVEEIKLKGNKPVPRHAHAAVYHASLDTLYIIGGFNEDGVELNDVWAFSLRNYTWSQIEIKGTLPAMSHHSAHLVGSNIFIFGGLSKNITLNTVFILEPISKRAYGVSVAGNIVTQSQAKRTSEHDEVVSEYISGLHCSALVDDKIYFLPTQKAVGTQDESMLGNTIVKRRDVHILQNLKSTETFASKIGEELLNLLNNKRYCDVTLHFADNQKMDVHKIVLAARSIPFRRILLRIKDITDPQEIRRITQEVIGEYKQKSAEKLKASQEIIKKHSDDPEKPQGENSESEQLLQEVEEENKNKEMTEEEKQLEEEQKDKDEHKIFLNQHSDIYLEEFDYNTFKQMLEYLYSDRVTLTPQNAMNLLPLAQVFQLSQLARICTGISTSILVFPTSTLNSDLSWGINNPLFSDVEIIIEGTNKWYAHRCVIAARSSYFDNMFSGRFRESRERQIAVDEIDFELFKELMKYTYSDQIDADDTQKVFDLMCQTTIFDFEQLKKRCETELLKSVARENVCALLDAACFFNAQNLKRICMRYILAKLDELLLTIPDEILQLNPAVIEEINNVLKNIGKKPLKNTGYKAVSMCPTCGIPTQFRPREWPEKDLPKEILAELLENGKHQKAEYRRIPAKKGGEGSTVCRLPHLNYTSFSYTKPLLIAMTPHDCEHVVALEAIHYLKGCSVNK